MIVAALLSALHMLTLALGAAAIFTRGRALAAPLEDKGWSRVLAADTLWGVAAALWIATGLARVFWGGKEPGFYWNNGFFWLKMALFVVVFGLEMMPMMTFMRVRNALNRGTTLPHVPIETLRKLNSAEMHLVIAIVFVAAFMARGAWLF